jgi:hypothetical protein
MSNLKYKKKPAEDVTENFYKSLMMDSEEVPEEDQPKTKATKRSAKKKTEEPKEKVEKVSQSETIVASTSAIPSSGLKSNTSHLMIQGLRKKKKPTGPSFFSLYFFVPCILLSAVHVAANFYWHRTFYSTYFNFTF